MIATQQYRQTMTAVYADLLARGSMPSPGDVQSAMAERVPVFGAPTLVPGRHRDGQPLDIAAYNDDWTRLARDLELLMTALSSHSVRLALLAESSAIAVARTESLRAYVAQQVASARITQGRVATLLETFFDTDGIIADHAHTSWSPGAIQLAAQGTAQLVSLLDLRAAVSGTPLDGTEVPILGLSLTWALDPTHGSTWLTQMQRGGGGATYQVTATWETPTVLSGILAQPSHAQTLAYAVRDADGWTTIGATFAPRAVTGIRVLLTRTVGVPFDTGFRYTVGLRGLYGVRTGYAGSATLTSRAVTLPSSSAPTTVTLLADANLPSGTQIAYDVTVDGATWVPMSPGQRRVITSVPEETWSLDDPTGGEGTLLLTPATQLAGLPVATAALPIAGDRRLRGGALYIGDRQWRLRAYAYDWSQLPNVLPSPDLFTTPPVGVQRWEIRESWPELCTEDGSASCVASIAGDRVTLAPGMAYWYHCAIQVTAPISTTSGQLGGHDLSLFDLARSAALDIPRATLYLDGSRVPISGGVYQFTCAPGWHTLDLFLVTPTTCDVGTWSEITLGTDAFTPGPAVAAIVGDEQSLQRVDQYDLRFNTPLRTPRRYAVDRVDDVETLFVPYLTRVRYVAMVPGLGSEVPWAVQWRATLTTTTAQTPTLSRIALVID